MKYLILTLLITLCITSCAKQYVPVRYECLPDPPIEVVQVKNGYIDKDNTPKVVRNHIKAWEYIEYLKQKGCK